VSARPPLLVNVADVLRHLGVRNDLERTVQLPGLAVVASSVPEDTDLVLEAVLESTASGAVNVHGLVHAQWKGECRRCLRLIEGPLDAEVQEVFERVPVEGETYPLVDDQINLEPLVRDAILLALPLAPLCAEGCRGPDPEDFPVETERDPGPANEAEAERPIDPRWAALDELNGAERAAPPSPEN